MQAYFELRQELADFYSKPADWDRAAKAMGLDAAALIELPAKSLTVWANFLDAVRTPEKMQLLLDLVARESPETSPLAQRYADEVAKGESVIIDLPELRAVSLNDQDLAPATVGASLNFATRLPYPLFALSLQAGTPSGGSLDIALSGANTVAAYARLTNIRGRHADERKELLERRNTTQSSLNEVERKISSIKNEPRPIEPRSPDTSNVSDKNYGQMLFNQYLDAHRKYENSLAGYQSSQQQLPSLQNQADGFRRDISQLSSDLSSQQARAEAEERPFFDDITRARDQDFRLTLDQTLRGALTAMHEGKDCFGGFWILLGVDCLLDLFDRTASDAAAVSSAHDALARGAETVVPLMKAGLAEIAKGCLAGPMFVSKALDDNRKALAALLERLAQLPTDRLKEACERWRQFLEGSLPPVPGYAELEDPAKIDAVTRDLREIHSFVGSRIVRIEAELKGESSELRSATDAAQTDADAVISAIGKVGADNSETLKKNSILWQMIRRGSESRNLPTYMRTLCAALPQEVLIRLDCPVDKVLDLAGRTQFGLADAQAALDGHVLTAYETDRKGIQRRLADSKSLIDRVEAVLSTGEVHIKSVAEKYRMRFYTVEVLTVVPGAGFVAAIWASVLLTRLKPLMMSDKPAYAELVARGHRSTLWSTLLSGVGALAATTTLMVGYGGDYLDGSYGEALACAAIAYCASLAVSFRNLLKVKEYRQERNRLFPRPAS